MTPSSPTLSAPLSYGWLSTPQLTRSGGMGTINTHRSKSGVITYRARIQRKGQRTSSATFSTLKDARKWMTLREADILAGRHIPETKARHTVTVNELFDYYQRDVMPLKDPETQRNRGYTIQYWRKTFGHRYID